MVELMNPIFVQMGYYAVVLLLGIGIVSFIQRGFFWKFVRVKMSLGRLIMVKIRSVERDSHVVGHVESNMLVIRENKKDKRICIPDRGVFYRSIGIIWIDIDSEKWCILEPSTKGIAGFNAEQFENLYVRACTRPSITDRNDKIIMAICVIILLVVAFNAYLSYRTGNEIGLIKASMETINKGLVVAAGG